MHLPSMRSIALVGVYVLAVCCFALPSLAQQTLGSLNGTVLDPSGAAIGGATVTASDTAINFTETTTTEHTGYYQLFNLPVGTYTVTVTREGFETTRLTGIFVREAQAGTVDVSLKVGQVATSVEVTANPMLNATDASNGFTMDSEQIMATPLATGSFTQLAVLSPGANAELLSGLNTNSGLGNQNIQANGQRATSNTMQVNGVDVTNIFNGMTSSGLTSQRFNFNIGAGSTSGSSSAGAGPIAGSSLEGASPYGSVGNSLPSPPPETIAELRVNTSMYDAQQGATAGAQVDVNTIAGTNSIHGQVYGDLAENTLNAAPYFFNQQYQLAQQGIGAFPSSLINPFLHRWTAGGTMGGPIKRDKIFFFVAFQHLYSSDQATGLSQLTVPSALTNDRSAAGLDAAAVSYQGGGTYTKAIDPIAMALMNAKLPDGSFFIPSAQTAPGTPYQFGVPNVTLVGNSLITSNQAVGNLDFQISSRDRLSGKYYYQDDPVTLPYDFSSVGGFPVTQQNGAQVAAIDNTIAVGPHLNWEQRVGIFRQISYSSFAQTLANAGGPANFGINGSTSVPSADGSGPFFKGTLPGMLLKGFPSSQIDSPGVKAGPYSSFADMGFYQNRLNPSTNLIYTKGNHTFFAGGGYSYTQLNIENNRNGIEQITTSNFESFLQGKSHSATVLETIDPSTNKNNSNRYYRTNEIDSYLQDKWQLRPNLSVTLGVRYDYHGGMTEKYGNMFNFDPKLFSVSGTTTAGFTVNNAGFIVAGNNKSHPTNGVSDSTLTGRQWGISPRIGFAWSPNRDHGSFVIRGAGGMYYDRGEYFTYLSQPAGSGYGGPFGVTESSPLATYVSGQGTTLEDPMGAAFSQTGSPAYTPPSANPTTINTALQNTLNAMTGFPATTSSDFKFGKNCGGVQSQEGYTLCPDALNFGTYARNNTLPYTIDYSLDIQWQPTSSTIFDIGYVGNRGRHAVVPVPLNTPGFATASNPIWGETASYGFEVLNQNECGSVYCDYAPIAGEPWNTEDGGNTDFRVPYIGFSPNASYYKTAGNSAYDGLQTHLQKQLSHNYMVGASYTWSHTLDEQSDLGLFFTGGNPNNLRNSWASSDFDRTNVFSAYFEVRSPEVVKEHTFGAQLLNNWFLDGTAIAQSGEPYSLYEFYGAVGSITFGDFPTLMNPILGIKNPANPKAALTGNNGAVRGSGGIYIPAIDPSQIAINYLQPGQDGIPISTGTDPQDIYETDWAPPQRNIFRQAGQRQINLSVRKQFKFTERMGLDYEFNVFNVTNTTSLDVPSNQGQIRQNSACSTTAIQQGIANDENCQPGADYFVNYGQIVTSNNPTDQQTALTNLDQLPYATGSGSQTKVPLFIPAGVRTCVAGVNTVGSSGCPNNVANFGSVYSTIGSNRMITMGFHFTY